MNEKTSAGGTGSNAVSVSLRYSINTKEDNKYKDIDFGK